MEQFRKEAAGVARSLILLTPRLKIPCPHCKEIVYGNEFIPMEDPHDIFGKDLPDRVEPVLIEKRRGKSYVSEVLTLPNHIYVTPEELRNSAAAARNPPLKDLYNSCAQIYNEGPYAGKKTFVWGAGNPATAKVLFIGEAPGWQEDKHGIPFIGDAGVLLTSVLDMSGINRVNDCLLINTVTLIPDRIGTQIGKPKTVDMLEQRPRVIEIINRLCARQNNSLKAIVCLGKYPWVQLAEKERLQKAFKDGKELNMNDIQISRIRGWHSNKVPDINVPILLVNHPSYIMRIISANTESANPSRPTDIPEVADYLRQFKQLKQKIETGEITNGQV